MPFRLNFSNICPEPVLVKLIVFCIKMAQQGRFPHQSTVERIAKRQAVEAWACETRPMLLCPFADLSLSWQKLAFGSL
jgi:hypothetical protein